MSDYQLLAHGGVFRNSDRASIPNDPYNRDWIEYEQWLTDGGVPDPYVPPEPGAPAPTQGQAVAFDHENRLRVLEGQPPLTLQEFMILPK